MAAVRGHHLVRIGIIEEIVLLLLPLEHQLEDLLVHWAAGACCRVDHCIPSLRRVSTFLQT